MIVKNLNGAKKDLRKQGDALLRSVKTQVEIVGRNVNLMAVKKAPKDTGDLRSYIFYESIESGFGARITANSDYAAYQEFGTGGKVQIPAGFESIAAPFKTGDGTFSMKAQPYLIPAAKEGYKDLRKRLKNIL